MFGNVSDFELAVLAECLEGIPRVAAIVARMSIFAVLFLGTNIGVVGRAQGEQILSADSSDILLVFDTDFDGGSIELPRVELVALHEDWYASSNLFAQTPPVPPDGEAGAPIIVPPQNAPLAVTPSDAEESLKDKSDVVDDVLCEPEVKKADEKPVIPDLAKGILIQSNDGDLTFVPGLRIQPRYNSDENFNDNDFFINRFRLKGSGSAYGLAKYFVELQLDGTSRFESTPIAQDQNAWLDFILDEDLVYFRVGLFDLPFSRDALTSDSKLLFMDRSLIRGALAGLGLADDTVGILVHGRPYDGHVEYAFGVFDDFAFEKRDASFPRDTNELMPAGRIGMALLDPYLALDGYADYKASYLGQSTRLDVGFNVAHLGEVIDGPVILDLTGVGGDVFAANGHYTFQAEFDWFIENIAFVNDLSGHGWYVQGGYLFDQCDPCLEFAVRYQTLTSDLLPDELRWTSLGFNWYIRDHNLKVQTDYTFRRGEPLDENVFAVQFQLDF